MNRFIVVIILALLLVPACTAQPSADAVATAIVLTAEAQPTATPTPQPTATPAPSPTATATPVPLTAAGIFDNLSPAVVRIEADGGFGSGVLIEGHYILTNAHVVWPATDVIVSLTDGTSLEAVPVVGVDLLADLAVLGPIETDVAPLALADGEGVAIGSPLLLIGYPGDVTSAPRPTLTETLVSRLREQETFGLTYFQVSAPVAGGQSGGIAVTMDGEVIGLTGNRITEAQYGLIASAADIRPRVEALLSAEAQAADGRGPEAQEADDRHFFRLTNNQASRVFVADLDRGLELEVTVDGNGDALLFLSTPVEEESLFVDETSRGIERLATTIPNAGTHYLVLRHFDNDESYTLQSNVAWTPYSDPDDAQQLHLGESYAGVIDHPYDIDIVNLMLDQDEIVNVHVSSLLVDPILVIKPLLPATGSEVEDDNSGSGLFDTDAELTYQAPHPGLYQLIVIEPTGLLSGGYQLQVRETYDGAPTPTAPEPTPEPITSPFGELTRWESDLFPFAIAYPATFENVIGSDQCPELFYRACFVDALDQTFIGIIESDMGQMGAPQSLDELAESMESSLAESMEATFTGREDIDSANNRPGLIMSFTGPQEAFFLKAFSYMLDSDASITIAFIYADPEQAAMVEYLIGTFEVTQ